MKNRWTVFSASVIYIFFFCNVQDQLIAFGPFLTIKNKYNNLACYSHYPPVKEKVDLFSFPRDGQQKGSTQLVLKQMLKFIMRLVTASFSNRNVNVEISLCTPLLVSRYEFASNSRGIIIVGVVTFESFSHPFDSQTTPIVFSFDFGWYYTLRILLLQQRNTRLPRHRESRKFGYLLIFRKICQTGNLQKNNKILFLSRKLTRNTRKRLKFQKLKECARVVVGCFYDLMTFVVNFEVVNWMRLSWL